MWPLIGSAEWQGFLRDQRFLIEICLKQNAGFLWHGPGTFLIERDGVEGVVEEAINRGFIIYGFDGFKLLHGQEQWIAPQLDLIADFTSDYLPEHLDRDNPLALLATWPEEIWVYVTGKLPDSVDFQ